MKALSHRKQQKGAVLVLVTIALFTLLGFTALALDGGYLLLNKTRVQDAVDSAALSGAKTLDDKSKTHDDARAAVYNTMRAILQGEGFSQVNIDESKLSEALLIEFSHEVDAGGAYAFTPTSDNAARYIRVTLPTVPVDQFLSQLLIDIWQVSASAVAGPSAPIEEKICDVIPLLMCALDPDAEGFGLQASDGEGVDGDVIAIKAPAPGAKETIGAGDFHAIALGDDTGGKDFRTGLASGSCITLGDDVTESDRTEPGNQVGLTQQGLNTRFGIYNPGNFKEPSYEPSEAGDEDFYSDCSIPDVPALTFTDADFPEGSGLKKLNNSEKDKVQNYGQYRKGIKGKPHKTQHCLAERRQVKVPIADCSSFSKSGGRFEFNIIGVSCMFLNQKVTGNGTDQYVVAEMMKECPADGGGYSTGGGTLSTSPYRIVLFKDTDMRGS